MYISFRKILQHTPKVIEYYNRRITHSRSDIPPAPPDLAALSSISFGSITTSTSSAYGAIKTQLENFKKENIKSMSEIGT